MKKVFIAVTFVLSGHLLFAQDLISKIPANANVVASINTGKLLQLMPAEEWSNSNFGKKLLEMSSKDPDGKLKSVNDIGINFSGNAYYFHTENDSMHYNSILLPLTDAAKFDALFKDRPFTKLDNNLRSITDADSSGFMLWDNQQVLYVKGILKDQYFQNEEIANRHGIYFPSYRVDTTAVADTAYMPKAEPDYPATEVTEPVIEQAVEEVAEKPVKATKSKAAKKQGAKKKQGSKSKKGKAVKAKPVEEVIVEEVIEQPVEDTPLIDSVVTTEMPLYNYDNDYLIKKRLAAACTEAAIKDLFNNNPASSIATNAQYMKSIDASAVANIWIDRPMDLYYNLIPVNFMYGKGLSNSFLNRTNNFWYKNFTAKLFLEEKQMRLSSAVELNDDMAGMQEKMLDRKLNKKFLKYINSDSLLGYMTWAMDTKAYLENFPKMLESTYGNLGLGMSGDEYSVLSELISFLLDEEAVSSLVKGDGMVSFNGLYEQQVTYTDYVYDDNYNSTAVEKTKTDTLPRFLLMLSSDENNFERKLINYGIKKEVVKERDGFYEIIIPKSPMSLFFLNKEGVFFLTNSVADMQNISNGKFVANISKQEKKFLLGHNYTMFINPSKVSGQFAATEVGAAESLSSAMHTFSKMGNIKAVMNPIKANIMSGDLVMDVPANNRNSLKYIFDLFDSFLK